MSKNNSTDALVEAIGQKNKTNKKKGTDMRKIVILTVVATVAIIALFVAVFVAGIKWHESYDRGVKAQAHEMANSQVTQLK